MRTTPPQRFAKYFRVFMDQAAAQPVRDEAEKQMDKWLKRHDKKRSDIPSILAQAAADDAAAAPPPPPSDPRDVDPSQSFPNVTVLDLIRAMAEDYFIFESPHEYVAYTLWVAHTHVYERYEVTPRQVITSPTSGCGKSVVLKVADRLVARSEKGDNWTAASMYDAAHYDRKTLGVDEADNLDFATKGALRAIFNSGYAKGGTFPRKIGRHRIAFRTFVPLIMASIGVLTPPGTLPPPLMRRSIIILMKKHRHPKRRFKANDTRDLDLVYQHLRMWAREVKLNLDPKLPDELLRADPSLADNWRVMISIGDACSPAWGALAREAAIFFARSGRHEEPVVTLLRDIRSIFDSRGIDRISIKALLAALHDMESGYWAEFCGVRRNKQPHKLTETELRAMLRPLGIITRSVWPEKGRAGDASAKGYYWSDFEPAWAAYCEEGGAKTGKSAKVISLRPPESA
jgi:Protein of unknown function (DUF3631)